jgi:hypothetical protein
MSLLKNTVAEIIDELQTIPGIRYAPDELVENNNDQFPFAVVYPLSGYFNTFTTSAQMKGMHSINIELHVARKDLPRDFATVMDLIDEIPYQLMKLRHDSGLTHMATFGNIEYSFGPMEWAGVNTIGVTYTITEVKVERNIT